jgi:hypothetical protein
MLGPTQAVEERLMHLLDGIAAVNQVPQVFPRAYQGLWKCHPKLASLFPISGACCPYHVTAKAFDLVARKNLLA